MVALSHIGLGSFLSMQSYYGATFAEGTGAVVGVGLIRNITALMTGLTMAGLLAALVTPELRAGAATRVRGCEPDLRPRRVRGRARAAIPAGRPPSGSGRGWWPGRSCRSGGSLVGTLVGWRVAAKLVGVSSDVFFTMFMEMIWVRDLWGLVLKGMIFGLLAALFACHEGLATVAGARASRHVRGGLPRGLPGRRGDPGGQQQLVPPLLSRRAGVRPDPAGPAGADDRAARRIANRPEWGEGPR